MKSKKELTYEQAYQKLEEIVEKMNAASVPLDELMSLYEEGMELAKHCDALLKSYDARLEKVAKQSMMQAADADEPEDDEEVPF